MPTPDPAPIALALDDELRRAFLHPDDLARLHRLGTVNTCPSPRDFTDPATREVLARSRVVVTGWGSAVFTAEVLRQCPNLKAIVHTGGSVRAFVPPEVYARGIRVSSQTALNAEPVAEFCLAQILLGAKGVGRATRRYADTKAHVDAFAQFPEVGCYGAVIGLVGLAQISRRLIELLAPFHVKVLLASAYLSDDEAAELGVSRVTLPELMRRSDVISVHSAATPANRHLISAEMLALIKPGALFLNTARGSVVDQDALVRELTTGRFDAVLDVTEPEITPASSPLWTLPNVTLTPHWAGSLGTELFRLGAGAVTNVAQFLAGEPMTGEIDPARAASIA